MGGQLLWCHRWCDFPGQDVDDGAGFICDEFADDIEQQDVLVLFYQFTDLQSLFQVQSVNGAFLLHLFNQSGQGVRVLFSRQGEAVILQDLRQGQHPVAAYVSTYAHKCSLKGANVASGLCYILDRMCIDGAIIVARQKYTLIADTTDFRQESFKWSKMHRQSIVTGVFEEGAQKRFRALVLKCQGRVRRGGQVESMQVGGSRPDGL